MADRTDIEWCDSTWNPWIGCTRVSPACDNCYAAVSTPVRTSGIAWGAGQPRRRTAPSNWALPLRWNQQPFVECMACGWRGECRDCHAVQNPAGFHPPVAEARLCPQCMEPLLREARRRVFCASLADVFDNEVDPQWREELFDLIGATPNLDWLLLTKRIGNVGNMLPVPFDFDRLYPHVWIGATICNQAEADRDIPKLLALEVAVRFLSMEPLLGPVDLNAVPPPSGTRPVNGASMADISGCLPRWQEHPVRAKLRDGIDWVIAGGESGPHARPMHPDWARGLRDQCAATGTPFLFKQWGEWRPAASTGEATRHPRIASNRIAAGKTAQIQQFPNLSGCFHTTAQVESIIDSSGNHAHLDCAMFKAGKKAAGRLLDGKLHAEFPGAARG